MDHNFTVYDNTVTAPSFIDVLTKQHNVIKIRKVVCYFRAQYAVNE